MGRSTGKSSSSSAPHSVSSRYATIHAEIDAQMKGGSSLQQTNMTAAADWSRPLPLIHDSESANQMNLLQMTKRVDENAFRLVDFAAVYIESRDAHVEAINDLVLS